MTAWIDIEPDGDENPLAWGIWDDARERMAELLDALQAVADDDTYINYYVQETVERAIRKAEEE